jgi:hypothetical protein
MPIYKGSTEVTSGNLYKGSTEVQDGYKAADSFYVNETTLTIAFVDNTGSTANLNSSASISLVGIPGASFTQQQRFVTAASGYILNSVGCAESGDTGNNVTCSVSGGTININGTYPTTSVTVTLTITAATTALIVRPMTISRTFTPSGTTGNDSRQAEFSITFSGSGTATVSGNQGFGNAGGAIAYVSHVRDQNTGPSSRTFTGNTSGIWCNWQNVIAVTVQAQGRVTLSVPADSTYLQTSINLGATGASSVSS